MTGAGGFIGSHLTERLVKEGFDVTVLIQYNKENSWGWLDTVDCQIKDSLTVPLGDIRDATFVNRTVSGVDAVMHLAALISIPYSYRSPEAYLQTNVLGTLNILEACNSLGVSRLIHTSTSEVYGSAQEVPISELHPLVGQSPYSASKISADNFALSFQKAYGLPVSIARPFNTYGPRQSSRAVIPTIINQMLHGDGELRLGNLSTTRDFNYVDDTVDGFIHLMKAGDVDGEVFNFGSGFEISIGDLISLLSEISGRDFIVRQDDERLRPEKSEVERLCADSSKAARVLGWAPRNAGQKGLREGLMKTIEWFTRVAQPKSLNFHY